MNTEITDNNLKKPTGWIFYDAECTFCVRAMKRFNRLFAQSGFCWLPAQTPGTAKRLGIEESSLREEMKVLLAGGRVVGGVDAWAALFRSVWWLWPLGVLLSAPLIHWFGEKCYRWIARNRHCLDGRCSLNNSQTTQHRHAAFFEMP